MISYFISVNKKNLRQIVLAKFKQQENTITFKGTSRIEKKCRKIGVYEKWLQNRETTK